LIITHFDKDHVGGADWIVNSLEVSHVYTSYQTKQSDDITSFEAALKQAGLSAVEINGTQTFTLGGASFEIQGASGEYDKDESNNSSLIVKITFGNQTYLFMGDAQNERIEEYLKTNDTAADFLKVPYHGHYTKKLADLIEAVNPQTAVITNGAEEPETSEIAKTVSLLEENGVNVYQTVNGTITLKCTKDGFSLTQ
jgi:beta-lactamase superfamily II metal-dependent hydrolase